ncbi:helix-turn-helix domain-containing protein [Albidovulum sediminicola]|uniref:XRE family transcriptional regulator n=1 Tax=Albidovulum sediminicola TaxID=2984331 RepID=A0ABT2YXR5_9RHOB|nr:XRE family transcriptional regulator [Defluviimonas sp. WL0075]MCV2863664.1 XRE family transcriptional regulator [Defluviimonas sp. WL0075]
MTSETLGERLDQYRIGAKIRALRTAKGLGLIQLGAHTGLSAGMLSKIETGQVVPTLPTLMRIALVFGVGLEHFFVAPSEPILEVVRKADRVRLPNPAEGTPSYLFESLDFPVLERPIESYLAEFPPGAPLSQPHRHPGVEMMFVLSGRLAVFIHGRENRLEAEDSIYFEADFEHSYACLGKEPARAIVVVAPSGA